MADAVELKHDSQIAESGPMDVRSVTLTVLAVLGTILILQYAKSVLIPVIVGVLISYVLNPPVTSMAKRGIPRVLGSAIAIVLVCAGLGLGAYTLADDGMAIVEGVPSAAQRIRDRMVLQRGRSDSALQKMQRAAEEIDEAAAAAQRPESAPKGVQKVQVVEPALRSSEYLWLGGIGFVGFLGQFVMVLFLVYFLLVTGDLYKRKMVKIAGPTLTKKITVQIMDEINRQISGFLRVLVITSVLVTIATALALWWLGVQNYLIWGLVAGIFNSIPYLGPVVVTGGLGVITFMQFDDLLKTGYVCGVVLAITALEGWLLTPALMGKAAQMNPVAIFVGLLFWTWVWGVWGTILAVPMMMMLKAICDHVEDLQPVGELLGE